MNKFDLVILGAGSAGFAAAIKASELGKKTAIIENGTIGGTCVNVGCVPSKHLLHVGDVYYYSKNQRFKGIKTETALDFPEAIRQKDELVEFLRKSKYVDVLESLPNTVFLEGKGVFISKNEVKVGNEVLKAKKFLVATGSSPDVVQFEGVDKVDFLTNVEALSLKQLPESMIVIGGRALALEFAQMYAHFGTRVTVLQRSSRILPEDEPEISDELARCLKAEGIEIYTSMQVREISQKEGVRVVRGVSEGVEREFEAQQILMATGRKPNTEGVGLDLVEVKTEKDFIKTNEFLQTSNPDVYAAGDCASPIMLETLAAKMGNIAVRNAFENARLTISGKEVPRVVFTNPQVAKVGYTEEEYSAKTHACACRTISMSLVPKAHVIGDTRGVIKMVIDPNTLKIVGVHIVSALAADMIHEATLSVKFELTIDDVIGTVHAFPTLSEAVKLVAQSFRRDVSKLSCCVE
jgi:mercuric reductase